LTDEDGLVPLRRALDEDLLDEARSAMQAAYAPYSGYRVGAVLETADGRRFSGCNVENAAFPVTMCAERVALGAAIRAGAREFTRLALCVSGSRPASPCGMCRQALAEFADDIEVLSVAMGGDSNEDEGKRVTWTLDELLPARFGGGDLAAGTDT